MKCFDCGHPVPPMLGPAICDPCAYIATLILGGVDARARQLGATDG